MKYKAYKGTGYKVSMFLGILGAGDHGGRHPVGNHFEGQSASPSLKWLLTVNSRLHSIVRQMEGRETLGSVPGKKCSILAAVVVCKIKTFVINWWM